MPQAAAIGEHAPAFSLPNQDGQMVSLTDLIAQGPVVVFFYPKDETPGCTAEVCSFRDQFDDFRRAGASVVGISSDEQASHALFAQKHALPFPLLTDAKGEVRKQYGVKATLGLIPGRETFVIDGQGVIRYRFSSQFDAEKHISEALKVLQTL